MDPHLTYRVQQCNIPHPWLANMQLCLWDATSHKFPIGYSAGSAGEWSTEKAHGLNPFWEESAARGSCLESFPANRVAVARETRGISGFAYLLCACFDWLVFWCFTSTMEYRTSGYYVLRILLYYYTTTTATATPSTILWTLLPRLTWINLKKSGSWIKVQMRGLFWSLVRSKFESLSRTACCNID